MSCVWEMASYTLLLLSSLERCLVGPKVEISYAWGQSLLLQKDKEKTHCKIQDDIYVVKIVLSCHQSSWQASLYVAGFQVSYTLFSIARRFKITSGWRVPAVVSSHPATESHSTHCPLIQFVLISLGARVSLKLFDPSPLPWNCCIDFPWSGKICFIQLGFDSAGAENMLGFMRVLGEISVDVGWNSQAEVFKSKITTGSMTTHGVDPAC